MNLIFTGPQGSGKGTQAKRIAKKTGLCHISTGDLLRQVEGDLRIELDKFMSKGDLVPDELIVRILKERLGRLNCGSGFILDGFPRNVNQAKELGKIVDIDKVVDIAISDDILDQVTEVITKIANTCKIGDGKIFIRNLEQIIRIRTRETGASAL